MADTCANGGVVIDRRTLEEYVTELSGNTDILERAKTDQTLEASALSIANDVSHVVRQLSLEAVTHVRGRGINPEDNAALAKSAPIDSACDFMWTCEKVAQAFTHWRVISDYQGTLSAVLTKGTIWLADYAHVQIGGDVVHQNMAQMDIQIREAKRMTAVLEMARRGQQKGLTRSNLERRRPVILRAALAWSALGKPAPQMTSLITAAREQPELLAQIYGYDDINKFKAEALDENSKLRSKLKRDTREIKSGTR